MRVLIACEYSGRVRDAFIAAGHDAMSCDLMPTDVRVHDTGGNAGIAWSGVPTENAGVMRGGTPLYTHPQPPSAQPTLTAEIVERRLRTWRQRFVNRSGDQLALDDFLDRESLDDLVDFVCDEYSKEAKR